MTLGSYARVMMGRPGAPRRGLLVVEDGRAIASVTTAEENPANSEKVMSL